MKKKILIALSGLTFVFGLSSIIYFYGPWWFTKVHDYDDRYGTVGSIELPKGYERVNDGTGFDEYLRDLPLASEDVQVHRITGELADTLNPYCYRVVNLPLMHHYEQCADVCMRLRAEYLFRTRQFWKIHFDDTQFNTMRNQAMCLCIAPKTGRIKNMDMPLWWQM